MIPQYWSFALMSVALTGEWLVGSRRRVGWYVALAGQAGWAAYALVTQQYGFLVGAVAFSLVFLRNLRAWAPEGEIEMDGFWEWSGPDAKRFAADG